MVSQPFCFTREDYEREAEKRMLRWIGRSADDAKIMRFVIPLSFDIRASSLSPVYSWLIHKRLSSDGCSACYGHGDVLRVLEREFSQLDRDLLDAEMLQQVHRKPIGQCLDQIY